MKLFNWIKKLFKKEAKSQRDKIFIIVISSLFFLYLVNMALLSLFYSLLLACIFGGLSYLYMKFLKIPEVKVHREKKAKKNKRLKELEREEYFKERGRQKARRQY